MRALLDENGKRRKKSKEENYYHMIEQKKAHVRCVSVVFSEAE